MHCDVSLGTILTSHWHFFHLKHCLVVTNTILIFQSNTIVKQRLTISCAIEANRLRGALQLLPPLLNALDRSGDGSQRPSSPSDGIINISSEAFVTLKFADHGLDVVGPEESGAITDKNIPT